MKKVKDHYFHKAKQEQYPARSVYKLEEAQKKYNLLKRGDKILDLGCHPGSWSLYTARIVGKQGKVVGVDLQRSSPRSGDNMAAIEFIQSDIFSEELMDIVSRKGKFHGVISDLAPMTTGSKFADHVRSVEIAARALTIAERVLVSGGFFYCKVFQGEDFQPFVDKLKKVFKKVRIVKPKSSRGESREVFTLGTGYIMTDGEDL